MKALLVDSSPETPTRETRGLLMQDGWEVIVARDYHEALKAARLNPPDAIVLPAPKADVSGVATFEANAMGAGGAAVLAPPQADFDDLLRLVENQRIATVILADGDHRALAERGGLVEVVRRSIQPDELRGRFAMIERYHDHFRRMDQEVRAMERLGKRLNQHLREVDQEMRLAARLQRDFLPQIHEPINGVQFASIYRPATWVSGDIFDICRVDEDHTAFYVADAVGHGMAASLLTIFIKRAIVSKRVRGSDYEVVNPTDTMAELNAALAEQGLPNCQFVTACYALLNHRTLTLRFARGGHPYPVLISPEGSVSELKCAGGLLGIFKEEEFPTGEARLRPGDKLLLYTDGLELVRQSTPSAPSDGSAFLQSLAPLGAGTIHEAMQRIEGWLDNETGSLNPQDDVTVVGLEVLPQ
ncbi:MAG: SpoIIE family protein phosphatase [Phycisphaerae bacterium]|nr:SpoIIE family protein phosphatase [Phycisphaerae bacterium]